MDLENSHVFLQFRNHPLSIEAIFPTLRRLNMSVKTPLVTILCQSRLFFPLKFSSSPQGTTLGNHPLSIEAIFPTLRPLSVNQRQLW